jgi:lipoprotein-anchoring transpeptidase ErfK/SrfK
MIWRPLNIALTTLLVAFGGFTVLSGSNILSKVGVLKSPLSASLLIGSSTELTSQNQETASTSIAVVVSTSTPPGMSTYIEITDSCGPYFEGGCLNMRSGPGTDFPSTGLLRNGMILKVAGTVKDADGNEWYKIVYDEWLRYPERVVGDYYVSAKHVTPFFDHGIERGGVDSQSTSTKRIVVDRSEQTLTAYDGDSVFMQEKISTGLDTFPTPDGSFFIFKKTPTRYMQGPIPDVSVKVYDLPGVPWNLYFTSEGDVIHGAYWHNNFGHQMSNGCINMPPEKAHELYNWAQLGTPVTIQE